MPFVPLRMVMGLALLAGILWLSLSVQLGRRTLAGHMHAIGRTPEAKELVEGARGALHPMVEEAASRVLGERVEAPTKPVPAEGPEPHKEGRQPSVDGTSRLPGRGP